MSAFHVPSCPVGTQKGDRRTGHSLSLELYQPSHLLQLVSCSGPAITRGAGRCGICLASEHVCSRTHHTQMFGLGAVLGEK